MDLKDFELRILEPHEKYLNEREHAEHALGVFRLWFKDARDYMSDELRKECEAAIEIGKDGFTYRDQCYFVDLIARAYDEYRQNISG